MINTRKSMRAILFLILSLAFIGCTQSEPVKLIDEPKNDPVAVEQRPLPKPHPKPHPKPVPPKPPDRFYVVSGTVTAVNMSRSPDGGMSVSLTEGKRAGPHRVAFDANVFLNGVRCQLFDIVVAFRGPGVMAAKLTFNDGRVGADRAEFFVGK